MNAVRAWASDRRSRIAIGLLLLVWIYFLIAFGEQAFRANQLQAQVQEQREDIELIRAENAELETELARLNTDDGYRLYAEGIARRDLGLARPGDTVVLLQWNGDPPAGETAAADQATPDRPNWQRWLDLLMGDD